MKRTYILNVCSLHFFASICFSLLIKLSIHTKSGLKVLEAELISATYLMDNRKHSRTFQNASMSYDDVLNLLSAGYEGYGVILMAGRGEPIGDMIVQYEETDWQFAKRLASHFNSVLVPADHVGGIKYYFGLPNRNSGIVMQPVQYSMQKALGE